MFPGFDLVIGCRRMTQSCPESCRQISRLLSDFGGRCWSHATQQLTDCRSARESVRASAEFARARSTRERPHRAPRPKGVKTSRDVERLAITSPRRDYCRSNQHKWTLWDVHSSPCLESQDYRSVGQIFCAAPRMTSGALELRALALAGGAQFPRSPGATLRARLRWRAASSSPRSVCRPLPNLPRSSFAMPPRCPRLRPLGDSVRSRLACPNAPRSSPATRE
jgi:hypothetical protein